MDDLYQLFSGLGTGNVTARMFGHADAGGAMTETTPRSNAAPVIVIGGGPSVGMDVAVDLDQLGLRSILVRLIVIRGICPRGAHPSSVPT